MNCVNVIVLFLLIALTGCQNEQFSKMIEDKLTTKEPVEEPLVEPIEDVELAKIILKPKVKVLNITRDPFKPILIEGKGKNTALPVASENDSIGDVQFLGVVKMGSDYQALLRVGNKQNIYKKTDTINSYQIQSIDINQIVLSKDDNTITLKRGEKK